MGAAPIPKMSVEEYLAADRVAEVRSEYYDGEMFPVAVSSLRHGVITANLGSCLVSRLRGRGCLVGNSAVRVKVGPKKFVYPDVLVVCGKPAYAVEDAETITNPKLVIEVLSPSTQGHDYGTKSVLYRKLESVEESAFVWQDAYFVEVLRRQPGGFWMLTTYEGSDAVAEFSSLGVSVPLAEVYEGLDLAAAVSSDRTRGTRRPSRREAKGTSRR